MFAQIIRSTNLPLDSEILSFIFLFLYFITTILFFYFYAGTKILNFQIQIFYAIKIEETDQLGCNF